MISFSREICQNCPKKNCKLDDVQILDLMEVGVENPETTCPYIGEFKRQIEETLEKANQYFAYFIEKNTGKGHVVTEEK